MLWVKTVCQLVPLQTLECCLLQTVWAAELRWELSQAESFIYLYIQYLQKVWI